MICLSEFDPKPNVPPFGGMPEKVFNALPPEFQKGVMSGELVVMPLTSMPGQTKAEWSAPLGLNTNGPMFPAPEPNPPATPHAPGEQNVPYGTYAPSEMISFIESLFEK